MSKVASILSRICNRPTSQRSLPGGQNAQLGGHWAGMWEHGAKVSEVVELHERTARPDDNVLLAFRRLCEDSGNVGAKAGAVRCGGGSYLFALQVVDRQLEVARSEGVQHSDSLFGVWTHKPSVLASYPQGADKFNL